MAEVGESYSIEGVKRNFQLEVFVRIVFSLRYLCFSRILFSVFIYFFF